MHTFNKYRALNTVRILLIQTSFKYFFSVFRAFLMCIFNISDNYKIKYIVEYAYSPKHIISFHTFV